MQIFSHPNRDWCHICGERRPGHADIWHPANAEHSSDNTEYVRICYKCAAHIVSACTEGHEAIAHASLNAPQGRVASQIASILPPETEDYAALFDNHLFPLGSGSVRRLSQKTTSACP